MPDSLVSDSQFLTRLLDAGNRLYARSFHRVELLSPCNLPRTGPAIVIANHISSADPFLIQGTSHRIIRWMMAREYFDLPIVRTLCTKVGFIPVVRSGRDSASLKAALRTLDAGNVVGLFPEGRISPSRDLLPFRAGIGMMAKRSGAPVHPVAVERFPRNRSMLTALLVPHEAKILYGSALAINESGPPAEEQFRTAVQTLQQQALAVNTLLKSTPVFR